MAVFTLSTDDLGKLLLEEGFSNEIASAFQEHGIDGATFCEMSDNHLREVAPKICDRVKLKKIQDCTANKVNKIVYNKLGLV